MVSCNVTAKKEGKELNFNGHEYVDLGLPSGTLWATCNVGATKPEECGDYYAWGEVTPKDVYDWTTYKWCNGSDTTITKYVWAELIVPQDDAAYVHWGGDWRIPNHFDFYELMDECKWEWVTQNGIDGYKVISNHNENFIFLPAAGFRAFSSLIDVGTRGYYWTAITGDSFCDDCFMVDGSYCYFYQDFFICSQEVRCYGHTIRPVVKVEKDKKTD